MVQAVKPEEWDEMRRRRENPDELTEFDHQIIGSTCRLEIPFRDVYRMRQAADLLRGYAEQLDFYSRRTDLPARTILFHLRSEARALNHKLRNTQGPGRPKKDGEDA